MFEFMGSHPILTVILALIIGQTIIYTAAALRGGKDDKP